MTIAKRFIAAASLVTALGASAAPATVTIQPSSIGFKEALAACPAGTLGAISIALNHLRVSEAAGVDSDIDSANPSAQTVMLSNGSQSATATVNAAKHTVAARHV